MNFIHFLNHTKTNIMKYTSQILAGLALAASLHAQGFKTGEFPYLLATPSSNFAFDPIITTGDRVPLTTGAGYTGDQYAFAGIPDAMGIYKDRVSGQNILFVAHEISSGTQSTPLPGQATFKGAFVSRFDLAANGNIISGGPAHKELFFGNTFGAAEPPRGSSGPAFTRFCSGSFAGPEHGMDRPMFLTNEESASGNYNAAGSQSVMVVDGKMHTLPDLGRVVRETTLVQPRRDAKTVVISSEDGGSPSFVYMYVGTKQRRSSSVLDKNGFTGGKTYVLAGRDAAHNEGTFTSGSLPIKWVEIANAKNLNASEMNDASTDAGAFGFVRVEDIEFDPAAPTRSLILAVTGGSGPNRLGRLYEVTMNPVNPIGDGTLKVIYNADDIITPGGTYSGVIGGALGSYSGGDINAGVDFAVSVDNIAVSEDFIMLCEDTNSPADAVYAKYARNSGLWSLDRNNNNAAKLESTFNYAAIESRDSLPITYTAGRFESSGIIASDAIFGPGSFVVNVQAHNQQQTFPDPDGDGPLPAPSPITVTGRKTALADDGVTTLTGPQFRSRYVEDGQVLIMRPKVDK
jgi:hypothetical protein